MEKRLLIIGAGGHAKVVADCALSSGYEKIAFLDDNPNVKEALGFPVIGKVSDAEKLVDEYSEAFVALGNNSLRLRLIRYLVDLGYKVPAVVHPSAIVSRFADIKSGTVVMPGAVVNAGAQVGVGCIINTNVTVEHECIIGSGVHISPSAALCGTVIVGEKTWICAGATIGNNLTIGSYSMVAAGAAVIEDIPDYCMAAGVPAVVKKKIKA